ncbi:M35 family metallo-endopeptidase [Roseococcus thiosulfatophilus]|uniref:M35 family metallo-endopeptidase n=1 Tax=Roseococcus thiosulfatophilus TaxID=35813 RepID=UPI001A8DB7DD|nr:M35 family metallo-endopeptidase [Roseococcus thiosulfatophilus]
MTRFTTQQSFTIGTGQLVVMTRPTTNIAVYAAAKMSLSLARAFLRRTTAALQTTNGPRDHAALAARYFLTPPTRIDAASLGTILQILTQTKTGLEADVTLKVGDNVGSGDSDDLGEVNGVSGGVPTKPYHNMAIDRGDGTNTLWGAIKLNDDRLLSGKLGAQVLIHEATHKYAGTDDYCYFKDDAVTPEGVFTDKAQALINADSYAWFAVMLGSQLKG